MILDFLYSLLFGLLLTVISQGLLYLVGSFLMWQWLAISFVSLRIAIVVWIVLSAWIFIGALRDGK